MPNCLAFAIGKTVMNCEGFAWFDIRAKRLHYEADFQTQVPNFRGSNLGFLKTKAGIGYQRPDVQDHQYVTAFSTRTCKELVQKTRRSADCVASAARYRG